MCRGVRKLLPGLLRAGMFWLWVGLVGLVACNESAVGEAGVWILYDPRDAVVIMAAEDTTSAELASIDEALAMWAAVGLVGPTREPVPDAQRIPLYFEKAAPFSHGIYQPALGNVVINRYLANPRDRSITIAHELGHAFGLLHVDRDVRGSVMNAGNLTIAPTAEDVAALARYWGRCPE